MKCLLCGIDCPEDKHRGRIRKFCCRDHYLKYTEEQRNTPKSYCLNCGKPLFTLTSKRNLRKFCSDECQKEYRHRERFKFVICNYCGKTFEEQRDSPNLYCSRRCSARANATKEIIEDNTIEEYSDTEHKKELLKEYEQLVEQAKKIQYKIKHEKICAVCGSEFTAKLATQVCCSERCSKTRDNYRRDKRLSRNGKPDLSITLTKLYMRDGGICQICGRQIDFDCDRNSDFYPSIDHIQPLAKGGLHSWDNVQLACRVCNTLKSDKVEE